MNGASLRQPDVLQAMPTQGRPDRLASGRHKPEAVRIDRIIKGDLLGRDAMKRLSVTRRDGLKQHATLGVDVKQVAIPAAAELVQPEHRLRTVRIQ